jgi:hypothetical protein
MRTILALLLLFIAAPALADTANLTWARPPSNCDGSTSAVTGYKVYWGTVGRVAAGLPASSVGPCGDTTQVSPTNPKVAIAYNQPVITISNPAQLTTSIVIAQPGTKYYFAVAALDANGSSNLTNEVSKTTAAAITVPVLGTPVCNPTCSTFTGLLLTGETGKTFTVTWNVMTVASTVQMYEYPPKTGAIPVFQGNFAVGVNSYNWIPGRAGVYYSRVCGTTCVDSYTNSFLFYVKLAPPSGGGLD